MCKIMVVVGIKKDKINAIRQFTEEMAKEISKTEEDGLGYAAITYDGEIYGEKWLNKEDVFVLKAQPPKPPEPFPSDGENFIVSQLGAMQKPDEKKEKPVYEIIYNRFGVPITKEVVNDTAAIIMHSRKRTIGMKSIENTHPFVITGDKHVHDIALIHNGGITNHSALTKKMSTCDSEVILHEYLNLAMQYNPESITDLANRLKGEYAVAVLSSYVDSDGYTIPYVDIFKSNKYLTVVWIKELGAMVYTTMKYDIKSVCEKLKYTIEYSADVEDGFLARFDAVTGERIGELNKFELSSRGYTTTGYGSHMPYGPKTDKEKEEEVAEARTNFQEKNKDLFMTPYYDLEDLNDDDKAFLKELEKSKNPKQVRALELVKKAVGEK